MWNARIKNEIANIKIPFNKKRMMTQYIAIATNGVWYGDITILVTEAYATEKQAVLDLFDKFVGEEYFEDAEVERQNLNTIADLIAIADACSNYPDFTKDWTISLNQIKVIIPTKHIAVATNKSSHKTIISVAYDTEKQAVLDLFDKIKGDGDTTIANLSQEWVNLSQEWIISINQITVSDE